MSRSFKASLAFLSLALVPACAAYDHQDANLLGEANRSNIALQSVRDVNLPNSKAVETTSGVRAAKAVKALNEGKSTQLRQADAGGGGS
ncbi:hypothetical protein [Hyphomonas johnsonii]|jgi:hypothetical protein|uniref:Putative lipoprotein n=1 Tax=Hyphomonas johnsonii MHS-2 TaxID=1280950 RepID=A0A059FTM4_9PROT|nr:hypothetical protein [Hyphomonas johnsonii]KCZ93957.1 putative lipoprotein [Hyphomonas johnsonii MHS-2]